MKLKAFLADMLTALCRGFRPQQKNLRRYSRLSHHQKDRKRPHLIVKYGMRCFWCGCSLTRETMTIDHYIPLSKGGNNKIKNLRLACVRCNNYRGNSTPQETLEIIAQRSNISFPTYWKTPKYSLGQQMKQGQIIGVGYDPPGTKTASEFGEKWTYWVLANNDDIDTESFAEQSLEPMSLEDLEIEIEHSLCDISNQEKNSSEK